jgi:hypothetical protein
MKAAAMSYGTKARPTTPTRNVGGGRTPKDSPRLISNRGNKLGNAKASQERYIALARAAASGGDLVGAENLYQHAEHYCRLMRQGVDEHTVSGEGLESFTISA